MPDRDALFGVDAQPVTVSAMIAARADCLAISFVMGHSGDTCCSRTRDFESRVGSAATEAVNGRTGLPSAVPCWDR